MEISKELLKLLLPEMLINHFEINKFVQQAENIGIYFTEKSAHPQELVGKELIGHGFYPEITIKDFPLRGKTVLLYIKRRRWEDKIANQIVQ